MAALAGSNEAKEIVGEDGKTYQLEIDVFWDSKDGGDVRVTVAVDDGSWRAFKPLTRDFIVRPDGIFADELPSSG